MTSLSLLLRFQAKSMRNLRVMPWASTRSLWMPPRSWVSGLEGLMTATSNCAGGPGGRSFSMPGALGVGVWRALSTVEVVVAGETGGVDDGLVEVVAGEI